jgi:phospholipid/cholesterol/gamma-HCH transport system permease protein
MIAAAVARVGRGARHTGSRAGELARFIGATLRSVRHYPVTARTLWLRTIRNQINFTAVQALPFVGTIALIIGMTVIVQAHAQGLQFTYSTVLGRLLATIVVRELGPLLAAVVVIGRSGTAIAAELATDNVLGETDAMEALGVDPLQFLVWPRVVGGAISVALLTLLFNAVTLASAGWMAWVLDGLPPADFAQALRLSLAPADVLLLALKGAVFGAGIAMLCSFAGLMAERRPTEIPKAVTRGVVLSLLFVFVTSGLFSFMLYA